NRRSTRSGCGTVAVCAAARARTCASSRCAGSASESWRSKGTSRASRKVVGEIALKVGAMTDPIADMIARIRNAVTAKHTRVDLPASRLKAEIARILQDEGYIQGFKLLDEPASKNLPARKTLRLFLKYGTHGEKLITGVQRIS